MKQLTDERIGEIAALHYAKWRGNEPFARAVIAEFCKINGLTGEAQPAEWHDEKPDEYTPLIEAAHPLKTKNYKAWDTAMQMVGNRRRKHALVELVCWLLQRVEAQPAEQAKGQEPVAWRKAPLPIEAIRFLFNKKIWTRMKFADGADGIALDCVTVVDFAREIEKMLYTTPPAQPARELVGLTEAEIGQAFGAYAGKGSHPARIYSAIESRLREKNAGQPAEARSVPDGYAIVPIDPTDEMLDAMMNEWDSVGGLTAVENYRAMLAAAPKGTK